MALAATVSASLSMAGNIGDVLGPEGAAAHAKLAELVKPTNQDQKDEAPSHKSLQLRTRETFQQWQRAERTLTSSRKYLADLEQKVADTRERIENEGVMLVEATQAKVAAELASQRFQEEAATKAEAERDAPQPKDFRTLAASKEATDKWFSEGGQCGRT